MDWRGADPEPARDMAEALAQSAHAVRQAEGDLAVAFMAPQHGLTNVIKQSHGCDPFIRGGNHAAMKDASTLQRAMREPRAPSRRQQLPALALRCRPLGPWGANRPHLAFVQCNMMLLRADVNAPRVSQTQTIQAGFWVFPCSLGWTMSERKGRA